MSVVVSVIVPAYNSGLFLAECLDSILLSAYTDSEVVVIDDGSTDRTPALADNYAAAYPGRVKVLHTPNRGVSAARNMGIDLAAGKYIAFVDADDMLAPHALEHLAGLMARYPGSGIAAGRMTAHPNFPAEKPKVEVFTAEEALIATLYQELDNDFSVCGKLFRRELFTGPEGHLFTEGRRYEDLEITPRLCLASGGMVVSDAPVYYYRPHAGSFIHTWSDTRIDALWAVDTIVAYIARQCPQASRAALSRRFGAYYNIFVLATRAGRTDLADKCFEQVRLMAPAMLRDSRVRLKNKVGALVALSGKRLPKALAKLQN